MEIFWYIIIKYWKRMLKKYFQDYQSEEDENYEPTAKQNKQYEQEHMKKIKGKRMAPSTTHELYLQMKQEYQEEQKKKSDKSEERDTLELANLIMNSDSIKPNKRITFAGKEYILNEQTGQLEAVQRKVNTDTTFQMDNEQDEEAYRIRMRHIAYQYLNHVMQAIYNRSKKINAIGKSKLDWKGFVKQEGIQDKLKYNRKGGVIQNIQFMKGK